jgi:transposase
MADAGEKSLPQSTRPWHYKRSDMDKAKIILEVSPENLPRTLQKLTNVGIRWAHIQIARRVTPAIAREIYDLYKSGLVVRDIARHTSVSNSTVSRIAKNPHLYGIKKKPLGRQGTEEET